MTVQNRFDNIAIFLDTNILIRNFKMDSNKFRELLSFCDSLTDYSSLCITEMNRHEINTHFENKVNDIFNSINKLQRDIHRTTTLNTEITTNNQQKDIKEEFQGNLSQNFIVIYPSAEASVRVFERYYNNLKPFENTKKEFKDALIWETIHEYAIEHPEHQIYFVTENINDFGYEINGTIQLHNDFNNENGRILLKVSLDDLLETLEVIRPKYGLINQSIINSIDLYLEDGYSIEDLLLEPVQNFLFHEDFEGDYISGWGTDPSDFRINSYELNLDEIYESDNYLYIPIQMEVSLNFSVETLNPVYEPGEDEYISEGDMSCDLLVSFIISYDLGEEKLSSTDDLAIQFL